MFSHSKKYLFIVLIIAITASLYFLFFGEKWAISINNEHVWQYGFQKKEELNTSSISWKQNDSANAILEKNRSNNLIFQTTFNVDDRSQIIEGVLEYEFRYTCTIFINDIKYKDVHRNLITPSGRPNDIAVMEYWRPRQVQISQEFLDSALVNGENTIKTL